MPTPEPNAMPGAASLPTQSVRGAGRTMESPNGPKLQPWFYLSWRGTGSRLFTIWTPKPRTGKSRRPRGTIRSRVRVSGGSGRL